jgi:putative ABC transport system ATP-binding protein
MLGNKWQKVLSGSDMKTNMEMNTLEAANLFRFYHVDDVEVLALRGVSLSLQAGETVAVVGPSGSGKSTLMNCLAGLDEPDGGHVDICGKRLSRHSEADRAKLRAEHIGILLQSNNLLPTLSVEENIRLAMSLANKQDEVYLDTLLEQTGLDNRRHNLPTQLSGGETARAGLAVALAADPKILLADEPTGEVDAETEVQILGLLEERKKRGGAALIVTHSPTLAQWADRSISLKDGCVIKNGVVT